MPLLRVYTVYARRAYLGGHHQDMPRTLIGSVEENTVNAIHARSSHYVVISTTKYSFPIYRVTQMTGRKWRFKSTILISYLLTKETARVENQLII